VSEASVTGLVFDLPEEPWTKTVSRLRAQYDPNRLHFPIEVTVVGSSGLGWFSSFQPVELLVETVAGLATRVAPFACRFSQVESFPVSNVYYLALHDEAPFHNFQRMLAASRLRFDPTPFTYKPHCTIAALPSGASAASRTALLNFGVPRHEIAISSVSLYAVDLKRNECSRLNRILLGA
jgi:hypothetical protein